jgi:excisionase family DNA binding protein
MTTRYLTTAQAAARVGIPKRTLYEWLKTGRVKAPDRIDGHGRTLWTEREADRLEKHVAA